MHYPVSTQLHVRHKLLNMIETILPNIYAAHVNIWPMLELLKCLQWNILWKWSTICLYKNENKTKQNKTNILQNLWTYEVSNDSITDLQLS